MSLFGSPNIEKLKANRDVQGLVKALFAASGGKAHSICEAVMTALLEINDPRAVDLLVTSLRTGDKPYVRIRAAETLGRLGDQRAIQPLIDAFRDKEGYVVDAAIDAVSTLKNIPTEALVLAIKDSATSRAAYRVVIQIKDDDKLRRILNDPHVRQILWQYSQELFSGNPKLKARIGFYRITRGEGECFECGKYFEEVKASVYSGAALLNGLKQVPYQCKSCGMNFCVDCVAALKTGDKICPHCKQDLGW